ncbi:MAG: MFS transporter [Caldisericum sp.]
MDKNKKYIMLMVIFRLFRSLSAGMIAIAFPYRILVDLKYSTSTLGLIYTAATIATAIFGLLFGFLADIYSKKITLLMAAVLLPLSAILIFSSNNLFLLFVAAMLGGISATGSTSGGGVGGAAAPIQNAIITDLTRPQERTFYFSLLMFLGSIIAALGSLAAKFLSNKDIFLLAALLSLCSALVIAPIKLTRTANHENKFALKSALTIGKFTLTGMLNGLSQGLVAPFLIPFFVITFNISESVMANYAFISGIIASFALLAAPYLKRRFGFLRSIIITRGLGTTLAVIMPIFRILPVSLFIYFSMPALRVMALPVQQSAMTDMVDSEEVGRALGVNQVTRLVSSSLGTLFSGYMFDISEIGLPFYTYGAVMGINIFLYYKFFKDSKE